MQHINEIVDRRSMPGLLIIDAEYTLLYANNEAVELVRSIQRDAAAGLPERIPPDIVALCERLKTSGSATGSVVWNALSGEMRGRSAGDACSLRAFFVGSAEGDGSRHIMVLVEKVVRKHTPDFGKAKSSYRLSNREVEVLQWLCQGFSNREIAETMYISEYTVKDHLKKIMRNMGVSTRSGILAALR